MPFPVDRLVSLGASTALLAKSRRRWREMTLLEQEAALAELEGTSDLDLARDIREEQQGEVDVSQVPTNAGDVVSWVGTNRERAIAAQSVEQTRERPRASVLKHTQRVLADA